MRDSFRCDGPSVVSFSGGRTAVRWAEALRTVIGREVDAIAARATATA